jgi:hypothetical protein
LTRFAASLAAAICFVLPAACSQQDEVTQYSAPKAAPVRPSRNVDSNVADPHVDPHANLPAMRSGGGAMRAAIVLRGEKAWFFKLSGGADAVAKNAKTFGEFMRCVRFGDDGTPKWTVPDGWVQKPGNALRFATLEITGTSPALEFTVTTLPKNEDDADYVRANVNRWREQAHLPAASADEVAKLPTISLADGSKATLVELLGEDSGSSPAGTHAGSVTPSGHFTPATKVNLTYKAPAAWKTQTARGSRRAAFSLQDGEQAAEVTIQSFPAGAPLIGDPLANFNRWRSELGLELATAEAMERATKKITVSGEPALYMEMVGAEGANQKAIFATLFKFGDEMWFVKLFGDAALAARERERFSAFLGSIKLSPPATSNGK